jgi:lysylphosphatidylglycerol synthetase-like protein (DUF2156 family)
MLRAAMALLSTVQIGAQIKTTIERILRQTVVVVIAALIILAAIVFGLIAAYHGLISIYEFSAAEAAGIMAACLLVLGVIALAIASFIAREPAKPRRRASSPLAGMGDGENLVDHGVGKAMQQIGPVPLLAIAFIAGVLAGRR